MILLTVTHDDHIILLNVALQHLRVGSTDKHTPLHKISVSVTFHHFTANSLGNSLILRPRIGKKITVCSIHIGLCDITNRHKPLQTPILIPDRKRNDPVLLHQIPGILQRHILIRLRTGPDIHILDLRTDISQISRRLYAKTVQHIPGLLIDLPRSLRDIFFILRSSVLNIRISNSRTDGIRIRILMSDYKYSLRFFHTHPSFFIQKYNN